jgi:sec-independent protein translocase protein TatC
MTAMRLPTLRRKDRPTPDAMTLGEHLGEARRRIIIAAVAFVVAATFAAFFYNHMLNFLLHPYSAALGKGSAKLYVTGPLDGLSLRIKMAMFGGLILASPVILWQVWRFITPGLRPTEKRYVVPFVVASVVLFLAGCAITYLVLPHALRWLDSVGGPHLQEIYSPSSYLSLVLLMMLIFGLCFEFPVILVALQMARVVSSRRLLKWWRWAVILIVVAAAVFTPSSDPFSMLVLAGPLVVFYFAAIGIGRLLGR